MQILLTSDITEVVLVGGMTRMSKVQEAVKNFGKEPTKVLTQMKLWQWVPQSQGGVLQGDVKDVLLLDVTSLSTWY